MEIAELTERDIVDLARLHRQLQDEECSLENMCSTFGRLREDPNYILLGAKEDGCLVGSVTGIVCDNLYGQCRPFMVIEDVVVDENSRRKGVGSALLRRLEEYAIERDCSHTMLVTSSKRSWAIEFYQSVGFELDRHKGFKKRLGDG